MRGIPLSELFERLRRGFGPPLRKSEVAKFSGYSRPTIEKLIAAGTLGTVQPHGSSEERIPVQDAARFAKAIGVIPEAGSEKK